MPACLSAGPCTPAACKWRTYVFGNLAVTVEVVEREGELLAVTRVFSALQGHVTLEPLKGHPLLEILVM